MKLVALFVLLFLTSVIAACDSAPPPAGMDPNPTATPDPGENILSEARSALEGVDSLHFSFVFSGDGQHVEGTGEWKAPDRYSLTTEARTCPPPVPDGPEVPEEECDLLPWYSLLRAEGRLYSRMGVGFGAGPWEIVPEFGAIDLGLLEGGASPATGLFETITSGDLHYDVEQYMIGAATTGIRLTARGPSTTYVLYLDAATHLPFQGRVTEEDGSEWTWRFSDYGAPVMVEAPFEAPPDSPLDWLAEKQVAVVHRYLPGEPLWPDVAEHADWTTELVEALREAETVDAEPHGLGRAALIFQFGDGTELTVMPALSEPDGEPVEDHWLVTAGTGSRAAQAILRSEAVTAWWDGLDDRMPRLNAENAAAMPGETWPDAGSLPRMVDSPQGIFLGGPLMLAGRGFIGERVELFLVFGDLPGSDHARLGEASLEHGTFQWEGSLPENLEPGAYWLTAVARGGPESATGRDRNHRSSSSEILVLDEQAVLGTGRVPEMVYVGIGGSAVGQPLWPERGEDRLAIALLLHGLDTAVESDVRHRPDPLALVPELLRLRYADGMETAIEPAMECEPSGFSTICRDLEDHWYVTVWDGEGNRVSAGVVESSIITGWFVRREAYMPAVDHLEAPDSLQVGEDLAIGGSGWVMGDRVTLTITRDGEVVLEEVLPLTHASFAWEGSLPEDTLPGRLVIRVEGEGLGASKGVTLEEGG